MRMTCVVLLVWSATAMGSVTNDPVFFDNSVGPISNPRYLEQGQSNLPGGQTFTVGLAGFLDHVDIQLTRSSDSITHDAVLSIYPLTVAGKPDLSGAPLASGSAAYNVVPLNQFHFDSEYVSFDVSSAALMVSPGMRLAMMLTTAQPSPPQYIWAASQDGTNPYDGGEPWFTNSNTGVLQSSGLNSYDYMFRTYVQVPEPASTALAGAIVVLLMRSRTIRAKKGTKYIFQGSGS